MAYINKQDVLKAYEELSKMHAKPELQGSTQDVSALRYVVALDRFYKTENSGCNTRDREQKTKFCEYVGEVCSVCHGLYTPNFYYPLNSHEGDFNVGSNIFSGKQIVLSLRTQETLEHPTRKNAPLLKIKGGVLLCAPEFYGNIGKYLTEKRFNVAFVIWLLRNTPITIVESDKLGSVRTALLSLYTSELVDSLLPKDNEVVALLNNYSLTMSDELEKLSENDIKNLFDISNGDVVSEPEEKLTAVGNTLSATTQEAFLRFLCECTNLTGKSPSNYVSGLTKFVNERLRELVKDFNDIYDCTDPAIAESYRDKLQNDKEFVEQNTTGKNMYYISIEWYIRFLYARKMFSSLRMIQPTRENTLIEPPSLPRDFEKKMKGVLPSLQRIYYGAPGTGKSHTVNEITSGKSVVRTTFHPDSDYSTFVGCYKPTTIEVAMRDVTGKIIYENGKQVTETRIVYDFVPQAFIKAYIRAWENYPTPQYLVIEEINRGNCAQIFGDIFQLLDRDGNGFSEYPIDSDEDIKKHIAGRGLKLEGCELLDEQTRKSICNGEIMLLPNNLRILATMNTSDQSLFPIDSAFKRRWDWVYVPIAEVPEMKWRIVVGNKEYGWWNFLEAINKQIGATTNSEDKKLGYFFCQAKNNVIDAETFVSKVLFYLWNDVFKDYGFDGELFKATDGNPLTFDKFYNAMRGAAVPDVDNVRLFLENLGVVGVAKDSAGDADEEK